MARILIRLLMCALFSSLSAVAAWANGAVYAMTNAVGDNQILVYHRGNDGTLTYIQTIATGGGGSGAQLSPPVDSLGSQGSLVLDPAHHLLFAVNTESLAENDQDCQEGTITSFVVTPSGRLAFADRIRSRGLYPNSLTVAPQKTGEDNGEDNGNAGHVEQILYVLNAGGPGASPACGIGPNIVGFRVNRLGFMTPIVGSKRAIDPGPLNGTGSGENCNPGGFPTPAFDCGRNPPAFPREPAEVRFTPDGTRLIVTVKGTNSIYVFPVKHNERTGKPTITQAPGPALPTDFGFTFDAKGHLIVTEAFGRSSTIPAPATGAVSSYTITGHDTLRQISASVGDGGTAACWIALEPTQGKYAFVSNNLSNSLSSYSVGRDGSLTLLAAIAASGNGPNDLAIVPGKGRSSFLYVLDSGSGTVAAFQVHLADGSLASLQTVSGLPVNDAAQGLAAY